MDLSLYNSVLMNIHEYANKQTYKFESEVKGQCQGFYLVPTLSIYVEHKLRYE